MDAANFLKLKQGQRINLPMDQVREISSPANPRDLPWNQVATTTEPWFDRLSGDLTFFVEARDVITAGR